MDISGTLAPNSDQLDAVDLLSGPRTFTIKGVSKGNDEQPVQIHLVEFPRPWRPGKSMRRVLVASWGPDAAAYVGRRVTLYCDNDVVFGGQAVGGTRISAMSHIDKPKKVPLLVSRGKSAIFTVQPLPDAPAPAQQPAKATGEPGITDGQSKKLFKALTDNQLGDREAALAYISQEIEREIGSTKELTEREAAAVIDALGAEPTTGGDQ